MGKLRFVDTFGKSYFIISFIFYKDDSYLSGDIEILQFMFFKSPDEVKKSINKLPQKKLRLWIIFLLKLERQT